MIIFVQRVMLMLCSITLCINTGIFSAGIQFDFFSDSCNSVFSNFLNRIKISEMLELENFLNYILLAKSAILHL